jgi:diguanylate cyclase (GGDEF)-like protein
MSVDWFDNRTLLACNVLVAVIFCIALIGMRWAYPRLHGTTEAAAAFVVAIPGGLLMASHTASHRSFTIVCGEVFVLLFYLLCYLAVIRFLAVPGFPRLVWIVTLLPIACMVFFTFADDRVVARFFALGCSVATLRLLMGIALYRAPGKRRLTRVFAVFMFFTALVAFTASARTALFGTPADFQESNHFATTNLFYSIVFTCFIGIFFLALFGGELTAIVERRSQLDPLTNVLNRQGINLRFAAELERAARTRQPITILLVDIDHFKTVNDTHGHLAGDEALLRVSRAILAAIRTYDLVGRFGGDEFLILLSDTSPARAVEIAERIRSDRSIHLANHPLTLSIGVASAIPGDLLPSLIDRADAALYEAKRDGRNCVRPQGLEAIPDTKPAIPHTLLML